MLMIIYRREYEKDAHFKNKYRDKWKNGNMEKKKYSKSLIC